jgi:hypothetical protein
MRVVAPIAILDPVVVPAPGRHCPARGRARRRVRRIPRPRPGPSDRTSSTAEATAISGGERSWVVFVRGDPRLGRERVVGRSTSGTWCGGRAPSGGTSWRVADTPPPRAAAGGAVGRQGSPGAGLPPAPCGRDYSEPRARASAIVWCDARRCRFIASALACAPSRVESQNSQCPPSSFVQNTPQPPTGSEREAGAT